MASSGAPRIDETAVKQHLELLVPDPDAVPGDLTAYLFFIPPQRSATWRNPDEGAKVVAARGAEVNSYVGLALVNGTLPAERRAGNDTARGLLGLGGDFDLREPGKPQGFRDVTAVKAFLADLPIRETALLHSGHGTQPSWLWRELWLFGSEAERLLARTLSLAWGRFLAARAAEMGVKLDPAFDLSRVLRVGGSVNVKRPEAPVSARLIHADGPRHNPGDLADLPELGSFLEEAEKELKGGTTHASREGSLDAVTATDLPQEKLAAMLANVDEFRRVWEHEPTHSLHQSDMSLAMRAISAGWTDAEVAALIMEHRRLRGPEADALNPDKRPGDSFAKAMRPDYIPRTVKRARDGLGERPERREAARQQGDAARGEQAAPVNGARRILRFNTTDVGNGEALAHLFGDRLRYDWERERWLIWRDHVWARATDGDLATLAKQAARARYDAASDAENDPQRKWAFGSEARGRVEAALYFARGEPPIADPGDGWDANPTLLGCPNGVVELDTATLRPGRRDDRVTLRTAVPYDPQADCPRWFRFLDEILPDSDVREFVWRAVGYSLTGSVSEQCFFLLFGRGSNGKTLFMSTLRNVFGEYAHSAPFSLFDWRERGQHPQALAQLEGRRFVTASEAAENCRLNEDRLKSLAGGEPITAHLMRQNDRTFETTSKIWLAVNHLPRVLDDSDGFWRKARVIGFNQRFVDAAHLPATAGTNLRIADRNLPQALAAEAPGILSWAVQGAGLWATDGLREPDSVRQDSAGWRDEADPLADFLAAECITGPTARVRAADLYRAYCQHCEAEGIRERDRMSQTAFGRRVGARFEKTRDTVGGRKVVCYRGLGLSAGHS